jgi:hypothetical protein
MATGAGLAEWKQTHRKKKAKCVLTSTGLLMEGLRRFGPNFRQTSQNTENPRFQLMAQWGYIKDGREVENRWCQTWEGRQPPS